MLQQGDPSQDLAARVRDLVLHLESETVGEREKAVEALGRLGHPALPFLRTHAAAVDPDAEVRARIEEAIERVHHTDPIFLVRAPDRRVTVGLRDAFLGDATHEIFRGYPLVPRLDRNLEDDRTTFSLSLKGATFWEAIAAVEERARASFGGGEFHRPQEWEREWPSKPVGIYRFTALPKDAGAAVEIRVAMMFEPGWRPVYFGYEPADIEVEGGKRLGDLSVPRREWKGSEFCYSDSGLTWAELDRIMIPKADLLKGGRVILRGAARVTFATKVEALEYLAEGFKGPVERRVGDCTIVLKDFKVDARGASGTFDTEGPDRWEPPADKPFLSHFWRFLDDGKGNARDEGCLRYVGRVESGFGNREWPFRGKPVRLTLVRPVEVETVEIPLEIALVPLQSER